MWTLFGIISLIIFLITIYTLNEIANTFYLTDEEVTVLGRLIGCVFLLGICFATFLILL